MVLPRQLLLAHRDYLLRLVAATALLQSNAGISPTVRDGGHHGPSAGSAGGEAPEGGTQGEAPGGVRAWNSHRRARALGGSPMRRRALP